MRFDRAYEAMKKNKDKRIKLPEWEGYWKWENSTIMIYCKDSTILDIRDTKDVELTLNSMCRKDWVIVNGDGKELRSNDITDKTISNNGRVYSNPSIVEELETELKSLVEENIILKDKLCDRDKEFATMKDIKNTINKSGLTECEDSDCSNCKFGIYPDEKESFGNVNCCVLLNAIYRSQ